jgi:cephalosporin-C deacetylase-like acetyl esterase
MRKIAIGLVLTLICLPAMNGASGSSPELDFVSGLTEFRHLHDMLVVYLNSQASRALYERRSRIAAISTASEIEKRQTYIRERLLRSLGGLPTRTPLNARVVGTLERADYRIEKVIFESQPQFYVTANLYVPKRGRPPYPGVLFPLGHETGAKSYAIWQQALGTLAGRGFVALAWDPVGQGERQQFFDPDLGDTKLTRSVVEHSMLAVQCLLAGDNLARYITWDGLRALDYLQSRKEVDATRIACTGNSGGGMQTAYLAALDERIKVAAPSCWLTSWGRLLDTVGPQDGEQNLIPWLRDGLDHADFIEAFAPKPYLVLAGIRDYFSISGVRDTVREAANFYASLDAAGKAQIFEADDGHGYSKPRRMAAYRWLSRWLTGVEQTEPEPEIQPAAEEELNCTRSGQVSTSLGGESVYSLNRKRVKAVLQARNTIPRDQFSGRVAQLAGFEPRKGSLEVKSYGQITRTGYHIEKLLYESEPGIIVPSLLYMPDEKTRRKAAVLYVNGESKSAGRVDCEQLAGSGLAVLAIDLRGTGETRVTSNDHGVEYERFFGDYDSSMKALLIGRTLVGMRALDIVRGIDLLSERAEIDSARIYGIGHGKGAVPLLYAAVFDPRIKKVTLEGMLLSYESITRCRIHRKVFENIVPDALRFYDLPDLVSALAPRPVWLSGAVDAAGNRITSEDLQAEYARSPNVWIRPSPKSLLREMLAE